MAWAKQACYNFTMCSSQLALGLSAFISGAALMIAEVAGFRLLAPYLGGSIAVTSSILGVVLASLALGAWWGGRYVDQHPAPQAINSAP